MHSVYMITDRSGGLMYIGCTSDIDRRQGAHRSQSPWFAESWMIHYKRYEDRAYAERVEARAIRRYRPPYNKRDNPDHPVTNGCHPRLSTLTKAGMAARKAADPSVKWGARHFLDDYPERMEHLQGIYNAGEFSLEDRPNAKNPKACIVKGMTAAALMAEVNAVKTKEKSRPLKNAETIRRWLRSGAPGLVR